MGQLNNTVPIAYSCNELEGVIDNMVLKEAFRYQNLLDSFIDEALILLRDENFIVKKKETHNRKKVNKDANDEEFNVEYKDCEFTPNELIDFVFDVVNEKTRLTDAISNAKRKTDIDIDSTVSMNRVRQRCVITLIDMLKHKTTSEESQGFDYKFNENGDQVRYVYPKTIISTINFDRNTVRNLSRKWREESDNNSTKLDLLEVTTEVDFTPKWSFDDTLEDAGLS